MWQTLKRLEPTKFVIVKQIETGTSATVFLNAASTSSLSLFMFSFFVSHRFVDVIRGGRSGYESIIQVEWIDDKLMLALMKLLTEDVQSCKLKRNV